MGSRVPRLMVRVIWFLRDSLFNWRADEPSPPPRSMLVVWRILGAGLVVAGLSWLFGRGSVLGGAVLGVLGIAFVLATIEPALFEPVVLTADYIYGWRQWRIVPGAGSSPEATPALTGLASDHIWPTATLEAQCDQDLHEWSVRRHSRAPPDPSCTCGVHAWKTSNDFGSEPDVVWASAQVLMWGQVIETEHGYRSQFAKIDDEIRVQMSCAGREARVEDSQVAGLHATPEGYVPYCSDHTPQNQPESGPWLTIPEFEDSVLRELADRYHVRVIIARDAT